MPAKNLEPQSQNTTEEDKNNTSSAEPPQPVRELTQTDKLNKQLLLSFLERINNEYDAQGVVGTMPEPNKSEDEFD